jgi:DNA-binding GntR family transcriptional regulator
MLTTVRPINLREQVVESIRTAIIEGKLKPGDHMVEAQLTKQLGVSRTPLREALILLEREGLVESIPNRGAFVRRFDVDDVAMIFSMRSVLENFAAERIIDRLTKDDFGQLEHLIDKQQRYIDQQDFKNARSADMAFHHYFIRRSEHALLERNWLEIVAQIAALLYLRAEAMPDCDEMLAVSDHHAIVDAYRQHDLAAVKRINQQINARVSAECQQALTIIYAYHQSGVGHDDAPEAGHSV